MPLTNVFNMSLKTCTIPEDWKRARVTPIYEDGPKDDTNNYRPISVLPVTMKIMEKEVHEQLYDFIYQHNLINDVQSGFRLHHSTTTSLADVTDYLLTNMDCGLLTGAIFLDLKKAFDTVNHDLLLHKLKSFEVLGLEHCLFFTTKNAPEINNVLNQTMLKVTNWLLENKLTFNVDKTKSMLFGTNQRFSRSLPLELFCDGPSIQQVDSFKYLGIWLDPCLTWKIPVTNLCLKISQRIGVLSRLKPIQSRPILKLVKNPIVLTYFDICDIIWPSCNNRLKEKVQILQNRAMKLILSECKRAHSSDLRQRLHWRSVAEQTDMRTAGSIAGNCDNGWMLDAKRSNTLSPFYWGVGDLLPSVGPMWAPGQPQTQQCVAFYPPTFMLSDIYCEEYAQQFICEL